MSEHQPEPLIYAAWLRALQERLIRDQLGPLANEFTPPRSDIHRTGLPRYRRRLCLVRCQAILASRDLHRYRPAGARRRTDLDRGTLRHGAGKPAVGAMRIRRPMTIRFWVRCRCCVTSSTSANPPRGATTRCCAAAHAACGDEPFQNVHGAGYRGVYDFADPDSSVFITATGQSGHFLSRHYDDLAQLWRRGEYIPMSLDPELARAAAVGVTVLNPDPAVSPVSSGLPGCADPAVPGSRWSKASGDPGSNRHCCFARRSSQS